METNEREYLRAELTKLADYLDEKTEPPPQPFRREQIMKIDEAVKKALQQPTLVDALSWICLWESERIVKRAMTNYGYRANDTCFRLCIERVIKAWKEPPPQPNYMMWDGKILLKDGSQAFPFLPPQKVRVVEPWLFGDYDFKVILDSGQSWQVFSRQLSPIPEEPAPQPSYTEGQWLVIDDGKLISCLCQYQQPHSRLKDYINVTRTDGSVTAVEASILRPATSQDFAVERGGVRFIAYASPSGFIRLCYGVFYEDEAALLSGVDGDKILHALLEKADVPIVPCKLSERKYEAPEVKGE